MLEQLIESGPMTQTLVDYNKNTSDFNLHPLGNNFQRVAQAFETTQLHGLCTWHNYAQNWLFTTWYHTAGWHSLSVIHVNNNGWYWIIRQKEGWLFFVDAFITLFHIVEAGITYISIKTTVDDSKRSSSGRVDCVLCRCIHHIKTTVDDIERSDNWRVDHMTSHCKLA